MTARIQPHCCARCGARLADDNKGDLCRPCQRAARLALASPPQVPPEFWENRELRNALVNERHIGHAIRCYRYHPFHGHRPIAQYVVAGWLSISQVHLGRIENGRPITDLEKLTQWAKTLGIPSEFLWFTVPSQVETVDSPQMPIIGRESSWQSSVSPVLRKEFAAGDSGDDVRLPLERLAAEAAEIGEWAETGTAGNGTVNALSDEIERVAREYTTEPPGPLIIRASQVRRRAFWLMKRDKQRFSQMHKLHVVSARACAFMSVGIGDSGDLPVAALHADIALILAEECGDPSAIALALSAKSKVAFWEKRNDRAASFARRGFDLAPHGDPLRVLLACQEADASPVPQAREAIARAKAVLDDTGVPPEAGLFSCGTVRLSAYTTTLRLREADYAGVLAAAANAETAAASGEDAQFGSMAQLQISAGLALLATGDAEQAAARLAPVLGLPVEMRLATFESKLAQAAALAARLTGNPAAREITEQVRGYLGPNAAMRYPLALGAGK